MIKLKNLFRRKSNFEREMDAARKLLKQLFSIKAFNLILFLIVLLFVSPFVVFYVLRPEPVKDINYGVTFSKKYAQDIGLDWKATYIKILDDLKARNLRLIVYWDDSEPIEGRYDFTDIDWQLWEAQKRGANVILAVGKKVPRYPECFEPSWLKAEPDENKHDDALYEYLVQAVSNLQGFTTIKAWQVENEPFFPFGECKATKVERLEKEVALVRGMDKRPILIQDSGEGGFWVTSYKIGDELGISMYRKTWFDFWGLFIRKQFYVKYPLAYWTYKVKADVVGVPTDKIVVTELQAEPWGPVINSELSVEERDKTMSRNDFLETLAYAQKTGFKDIYLWGAEWWLWEKDIKDNPFYWDTAKALFRSESMPNE